VSRIAMRVRATPAAAAATRLNVLMSICVMASVTAARSQALLQH
jgi:hypothetical protein